MKGKIEAGEMIEFGIETSRLRRKFPQLAKEIDKCFFDAFNKNVPKCGHATCGCQRSFEEFHSERNALFGTMPVAASGYKTNG
jgi:hypothetical protein